MKLAVFSHKPCWPSEASPTGYATDGGFPMQMRALSQIFEETRVVVPCDEGESRAGEMPLVGRNLSVMPVSFPRGAGLRRKLDIPLWLLRNGPVLLREIQRADAVHAPIPGDVGTVGMLLATLFRKPLFVRHCGNWLVQRTFAERFWKWFMERFAGGSNVMLATGGAPKPPSPRNRSVRWIFATSLTANELHKCAAGRCVSADNRWRLITVGRQEKGKGTDTVMRSLHLLLEELPTLTLDVVGDGAALPEYRQLAAALGVSSHVCFHGKVGHQRVLELLQSARVFCFPTTSEGFPKVVLEALACGLPVVTTRVSVLPQLLDNGCGILIDATTPTSVAQAIRSCLVDEGLYYTMSENAIATARQYSIESWRDSIGALLEAAWGPLRTNGRPG